MWTPSTFSHLPASLFPGLQTAGRGPRNKATHSLDFTSLVDGSAGEGGLEGLGTRDLQLESLRTL